MSGNGAKPPPKDDRLDAIIQVLRLMIETQSTHSEMLGRLIELATPSAEKSPLEEAMAGIAGALRDQTAALERIGATLDGLGEEVEAGVMRGLATALETDDRAGVPTEGAG
jgi:hypothetical protein